MALTSLTNLQPLHVHSVGVSTFDGSVSVGGTLTYEDVTNVDAIGIITARSGVNVSGGQLDVGSNIKLGNAGVITATSFVGSGSGLTGLPSQVTISTNADNRVITGGSGTNLVGEANLNFDGSALGININSPSAPLEIRGAGGTNDAAIYFRRDGSPPNNGVIGQLLFRKGTDSVAIIQALKESANDDAYIQFQTQATGGNVTERLRIRSSGEVAIGGSGYAGQPFSVQTSSTNLGYMQSTGTTRAVMNFVDGNSTQNVGFGCVGNNHVFTKDGSEKVRIDSRGDVYLSEPTSLSSPYSSFHHLSIGNNLILNGYTGGNGGFAGMQHNAYVNSSGNWVRVYNDHATSIGSDDGNFYFRAAAAGTGNISWSNRLTIDSSGRLLVNGASSSQAFSGGDDLIIGNTDSGTRSGITIVSNSSEDGGIYFSDGTSSGSANVQGQIVYDHGQHYMRFYSSSDEKFRIYGGATEHILQMRGGVQLSISDFAPTQSFSGSYAGFHTDNHGNIVIGLNAHLDYGGGNSGVHKWKQTNAHSSIGSAGMFIGGNGSNNNSDICFFANSQGSNAGASFDQDSWKFQISNSSNDIIQNYNKRYLQRGFFKNDTANQNANNFPLAAGTNIGGYAWGYQEAYSTSNGSWVHPYPDLVLAYHTGISFGAHRNYQGCRFFQDHPSGNQSTVLEIGNNSTGVHVTNTFTAGSNKGFRIAHPHPSKKYTHDLVHNAIEAPQMDLIYRGKVDLVGGSATVNIDTKAGMTDGTFVLLNRDIQCFTSNETGWTAVKGSVSGNILTITAQDNSCTDTISWMVVGERQDDKIKESELTTADGDLITEPLTIEATHM